MFRTSAVACVADDHYRHNIATRYRTDVLRVPSSSSRSLQPVNCLKDKQRPSWNFSLSVYRIHTCAEAFRRPPPLRGSSTTRDGFRTRAATRSCAEGGLVSKFRDRKVLGGVRGASISSIRWSSGPSRQERYLAPARCSRPSPRFSRGTKEN